MRKWLDKQLKPTLPSGATDQTESDDEAESDAEYEIEQEFIDALSRDADPEQA